MSNTLIVNAPAVAVGVAETPVLTVPPNQQYGQVFIRFSNTDVNPRTITVYDYDPSGDVYPAEAAGPVTTELKSFSIPALSYYDHGPLVLPAKRVISALCDAAGVVNARPHGFKTV